MDGVLHPSGNGLLALGLGVGMLEEEGELCLSSSPSSHDSYDIGVLQSAVCNGSKLKIMSCNTRIQTMSKRRSKGRQPQEKRPGWTGDSVGKVRLQSSPAQMGVSG